MGKWSRDEIDTAFQHMLDVINKCAVECEWNPYVDLFSEDAEYHDDVFPPRIGRDAIREWLTGIFETYPQNQMRYFPVTWYIIDEERGWVVVEFQNRMLDPGDGKIHQAKNFTLYKYAGNNQWSLEEDQYNPAALAAMLKEWVRVKDGAAEAETIFD